MSHQHVIHASIDPYYNSQLNFINFPAIYTLFNNVGDIVFIFILFLKENEQTQAIFILLFAAFTSFFMRFIAVFNYTSKVKNSFFVVFSNLFFGTNFYINKRTSVARYKLQYFPLGVQIFDQLNLYKISNRFYLMCSVYSIFLVAFREGSKFDDFFHFFIIKFIMTLIALVVEILSENRTINSFLHLTPILMSSALLPLLASYSTLGLKNQFEEGLNFVYTLLRFCLLSTLIILRLCRTERVSAVLRRSKTHINFGIVLFVFVFLFFFWDLANFVVSCLETKEIRSDIIELTNFSHALLVLILMNFVYRFEVFKDVWHEPEEEVLEAEEANTLEAAEIHQVSL